MKEREKRCVLIELRSNAQRNTENKAKLTFMGVLALVSYIKMSVHNRHREDRRTERALTATDEQIRSFFFCFSYIFILDDLFRKLFCLRLSLDIILSVLLIIVVFASNRAVIVVVVVVIASNLLFILNYAFVKIYNHFTSRAASARTYTMVYYSKVNTQYLEDLFFSFVACSFCCCIRRFHKK